MKRTIRKHPRKNRTNEGHTVPGRLPVHTVYGGAHLFTAGTVQKFSERALNTVREYAPSAAEFVQAIGLAMAAADARELYERVNAKLRREPIEDFRIDFEDGFGFRSGEEEDRHALRTADETSLAMKAKTLPPFFGIRIKPLTPARKKRALRTLDLYLTRLVRMSGKHLPHNFVVCLPKVAAPESVAALASHIESLERRLKLSRGSIGIEAMVELPQLLMDARGCSQLPAVVRAGKGRLRALHFGPYDFTAALGIEANAQRIDNPVCDQARFLLKLGTAGAGVSLSDGPVAYLPVGPHRAGPSAMLTNAQRAENRRVVHEAWHLSRYHINRAITQGYHRGWDLHPAQLPVRFATVYASYLANRRRMAERMKNFLDETGNATLHGVVFDDAATGEGLLNFFRRGYHCGALSVADLRMAGLTTDDIACASIITVLHHRTT